MQTWVVSTFDRTLEYARTAAPAVDVDVYEYVQQEMYSMNTVNNSLFAKGVFRCRGGKSNSDANSNPLLSPLVACGVTG